jgi:hypothetical protein
MTCAVALSRLLAGAVLLLALDPSPAWADEGDAVTAEHLFSEARTLMAQKKFSEACPKLEASQRLDPGAGTLLNLASCYESLGRTASAWATFREAEGEAEREKRADWRKTAHDRADALASSLSRLRIVPPADATGVTIERDGKALDRGAYGEAVPVDPGSHEVAAQAPGRKRWSTRVDVAAKNASVEVKVPPLEAAPEPTKGGAAEARVEPSPEADSGGTRRTVGFVVGGVGIGAIAAGAVFGLIASGTYHRAIDDDCSGNAKTCTQAGVDQIGSAHTQATVSTILFVAGGIAAATGAVLVLTSPRRKERVSLGASVAPGGSIFVAEGRF